MFDATKNISKSYIYILDRRNISNIRHSPEGYIYSVYF